MADSGSFAFLIEFAFKDLKLKIISQHPVDIKL